MLANRLRFATKAKASLFRPVTFSNFSSVKPTEDPSNFGPVRDKNVEPRFLE